MCLPSFAWFLPAASNSGSSRCWGCRLPNLHRRHRPFCGGPQRISLSRSPRRRSRLALATSVHPRGVSSFLLLVVVAVVVVVVAVFFLYAEKLLPCENCCRLKRLLFGQRVSVAKHVLLCSPNSAPKTESAAVHSNYSRKCTHSDAILPEQVLLFSLFCFLISFFSPSLCSNPWI